MIISHAQKFVFVHNPKAAGTSIREALKPYHDDPRQFWHQTWLSVEERVVDLAHLPASIWTQMVPQDYFAFAFVREPYQRFVSGLREVLRRHSDALLRGGELKEFVLGISHSDLRWDWRYIHLCPQHYFLFVGNKCRVDKMCRMESLSVDWQAVNALLGKSMELPKLRTAPEDTQWDGLLTDEEVLKHVNYLYLRDFQLLGYQPMGGLPEAKHHHQRVEVIHSPSNMAFFSEEDLQKISFTAGELKALRESR